MYLQRIVQKRHQETENFNNNLNGVLKADDNSQKMQDHRNEHYYELRDKYNKHYMTGGEDAAMELMCLLAFDFNGLV